MVCGSPCAGATFQISDSTVVVATQILVARRRGGGEAQRLRRRGERADIVGRFLVIDLDALQAGDDRFLEMVGTDRFLGNLAQRHHRVLVAIAVDRQLRTARNLPGALRRQQDEIEPVGNLVDAIFDCHARHATLPSLTEFGKGEQVDRRARNVNVMPPPAPRAARHPRLASPADRPHSIAMDDTVRPDPVFTVAGNRLRLLETGEARLAALLGLIDGAQTSLDLLYYIFEDDPVATRIRDAIAAAARRGVAVALIIDGLGSAAADRAGFFAPLEQAGVDLTRFLPKFGRRYLLRNHQKLALADRSRAIIGGFNIGEDYFGAAAGLNWRDLGLWVEGDAAARLAGYFDALQRWARRPRAPVRALTRLLRAWSEPEGVTRWLMGGPTRRLSPWARVVRRELTHARRIDLIAAYFAPSPSMLRRLGRAAARGSRVRIVLPSVTDNYPAIWASRFTYRGLVRRGVAIHEYLPTKLHTKLLLIDDVVHIGSANFDIRSLFLNLELMLRIEDPVFAAHVRAYVDDEVAMSEPITPDWLAARGSWLERVKQLAAYFVMAVLDPTVARRLNIGRRDP